MPGAREERHLFEFDGGTISLDFVNTVSGMRAGNDPRDRVVTYPDLVYWAAQIGLIDDRQAAALYDRAEREPGHAAHAHAEAIRRREALHDVVLAVLSAAQGPVSAALVHAANAAASPAGQPWRPRAEMPIARIRP